ADAVGQGPEVPAPGAAPGGKARGGSAVTPDGPRIRPLPPEQWPKEMAQAIAALRPPDARHPLPPRREDRPKGLNALGTLAWHPTLTRAYHTFNGHVQFASTLSPRHRELLRSEERRVGKECRARGSPYQ